MTIEISMEEWEKVEDMVELMEAKGRTKSVEFWRAPFNPPGDTYIEDCLWVRLSYKTGEEWLSPVFDSEEIEV